MRTIFNRHLFVSLIGLVLLLGSCCGAIGKGEGKRILFIGNSYTAGSKAAIQEVFAQSPIAESKLVFATKGGFTLQRHLKDERTQELLQSGDWDYVVLQEQSQVPSLMVEKVQFFSAAEALCEQIHEMGATPVFFMTWGRRDSDRANPEQNPDYATMQAKLAESYRKAATSNDALLAPIGEAWALVREKDEVLGRGLYQKDGSHPSGKGAYLVACMLYRVLFEEAPGVFQSDADLSDEEAAVIQKAVSGVKG